MAELSMPLSGTTWHLQKSIQTTTNISKCSLCTGISMESAHIWGSYPALLQTVQGTSRSINRISAAHFVLTQQLFFLSPKWVFFSFIDCFGAAIWKIRNILSPALPISTTRVGLCLHLWSTSADEFLGLFWCPGEQRPQARAEPTME